MIAALVRAAALVQLHWVRAGPKKSAVYGLLLDVATRGYNGSVVVEAFEP